MKDTSHPTPRSEPGPKWRRRSVALVLFLAAMSVYVASPARRFNDSLYSLVLSESLLTRGTFALDPYFDSPLTRQEYPGLRRRTDVRPLPYQIESVNGHLYYFFPPGSSLLSLPAVAVARSFGWSSVPGGRYDKTADIRLQSWLAAIVCGAIVVCAFFLARRVLPVGLSVVTAVGVGFGSQVWSTASRALWSHTWLILLLLLAVHHLVACRQEGRTPRGLWLGSLLAWSYFVRPTAAVSIGVILLYVVWRWHRRGLRTWSVSALWMLGFIGYSWSHFGHLQPSYFRTGRLSLEYLPRAAMANLVSPGRGLFVFLPWLLMVAYLLIRYRGALPLRDLHLAAVIAVGVHWLVISAFPYWWGGHAYGPRLFADVIPWLTWLTVGALAGWRHGRSVAASVLRSRVELIVGGLLLVAGIAIQAAGALSMRTMYWNGRPVDVARTPSRIWDWSDPQFLAWRRPRPSRPATLPAPEPDSKWGSRTDSESDR